MRNLLETHPGLLDQQIAHFLKSAAGDHVGQRLTGLRQMAVQLTTTHVQFETLRVFGLDLKKGDVSVKGICPTKTNLPGRIRPQ